MGIDKSAVSEIKNKDISPSSVSTGNTQTETIGSGGYHFAGGYDGTDADARLDNALAAADAGDAIYLEPAVHTDTRTISTELQFIGPKQTAGLSITGDWTLDASSSLTRVRHDSATLTVNSGFLSIVDCNGGGATAIQVNADRVRIIGCDRYSITFASGTVDGIVDGGSGVSVTDNGSNTVGDIS